MKTFKLLALVLGVLLACVAPASAALVDYALSIPLLNLDSTTPIFGGTLTGTLSYDDEAASGTFSVTDPSNSFTGIFSGFAFMLPGDDGATGVLFDGTMDDGSELYFNVLAGAVANSFVSDRINYCVSGCAMFQSIGATLTLAQPLPAAPALAEGIVSPVPLPPAASLFGGALLALGLFGATRRRARASASRASRGRLSCRAGWAPLGPDGL